ncbi:ribonuclease HII [Paenibacillus doosanensis]|uniref:Ribonuclease HII n=2 Tax=Paenibacillus konkukensis TaxID=2020716 RepID=A0ABY4RY32_9BACL|nr:MULTISPECIES: ribonuclease HII [Paenibacillus]MCS7459514.1 ribonuclease HII [Paenibacillus doosanensis]UQZ87315.1 Ribonuclease HII [Paenibacillus konkukensis]
MGIRARLGKYAGILVKEREGLVMLLEHEQMLWEQGVEHIAGVDEVGRGCLFGDVVAAAVILPKGLVLEEIDDSKKLSPKKREQLYELIEREAVAIGVGVVDVATIEAINIKQAARLAMKQAVEKLKPAAQYLLVDAEKVDVPLPQMAIIHGDAMSQSIAAASIIAKVTRDRMCLHWDLEYPEYGLALHKGYATKLHREKILEYGATPLHRQTFLKNLLAQQEQLELF